MFFSSLRLFSICVCSALLFCLCCVPWVSGAIVEPPSQSPFPLQTPIPASRTAYVALHHEDGSWEDEASLKGIRTMFKTLQASGSTRDRIVLIPPMTSSHVRNEFLADGLILIELDHSLPFQDRCAVNFNKIHLWSSTLFQHKYDRIVFFDWDILVMSKPDDLFLCGEFCMVYSSILHFTDGVLVIKPNDQVYTKMREDYRKMRREEWHVQYPNKEQCIWKSYHWFISYFGNMEAAPLFLPGYGQSPLPLQRLQTNVSQNAILWYEKYSWLLLRSRSHRHLPAGGYDDFRSIPALTLSHASMKPFWWGPGVFFDLCWYWSDMRDKYLNENANYFIITRFIWWCLGLLFATKGIRKCILEIYRARANAPLLMYIRSILLAVFAPADGYHGKSYNEFALEAKNPTSSSSSLETDSDRLIYVPASKFSLPAYWLPLLGPNILGIILGLWITFSSGYILTTYTWVIPALTQPHPAWKCWIAFHLLFVYMQINFINLAYHLAPQLIYTTNGKINTELMSPSHTINTFHLYDMRWLVFWECVTYYLMRCTFYPEFIYKMVVLFPLWYFCFIATMNCVRSVLRSFSHSMHTQIPKVRLLYETIPASNYANAKQLK